ncbi:hypothetical protein GFS31_38120 [Leptolyngbya sp. BL0902]|nr:hypothetical protein GFS31_38120 [Leptolyngbya sp. BL0902]
MIVIGELFYFDLFGKTKSIGIDGNRLIVFECIAHVTFSTSLSCWIGDEASYFW